MHAGAGKRGNCGLGGWVQVFSKGQSHTVGGAKPIDSVVDDLEAG